MKHPAYFPIGSVEKLSLPKLGSSTEAQQHSNKKGILNVKHAWLYKTILHVTIFMLKAEA